MVAGRDRHRPPPSSFGAFPHALQNANIGRRSVRKGRTLTLQFRLNQYNYEAADGLKQAAYLFHGLLMNHGFAQGNKRTAYLALEWFLEKNSLGTIAATDEDMIAMCFAAENEKWTVEQIEQWLRGQIQR